MVTIDRTIMDSQKNEVWKSIGERVGYPEKGTREYDDKVKLYKSALTNTIRQPCTPIPEEYRPKEVEYICERCRTPFPSSTRQWQDLSNAEKKQEATRISDDHNAHLRYHTWLRQEHNEKSGLGEEQKIRPRGDTYTRKENDDSLRQMSPNIRASVYGYSSSSSNSDYDSESDYDKEYKKSKPSKKKSTSSKVVKKKEKQSDSESDDSEYEAPAKKAKAVKNKAKPKKVAPVVAKKSGTKKNETSRK